MTFFYDTYLHFDFHSLWNIFNTSDDHILFSIEPILKVQQHLPKAAICIYIGEIEFFKATSKKASKIIIIEHVKSLSWILVVRVISLKAVP